jgi:hypothetical protein
MVPGVYQGKKVFIIRPAASTDEGYDPTRSNLVVIRYDLPPGTENLPHEIVVPREEVKHV